MLEGKADMASFQELTNYSVIYLPCMFCEILDIVFLTHFFLQQAEKVVLEGSLIC